jgi:hypothetical protein
MAAVATAVGASFFIGPIHSDTVDTVAEFAALTWVQIGKVRTIGRFGDKAALITYRTLEDKREHKLKGTRNAGAITLGVARDPLDAGQVAVEAAAATDFRYALKMVANDKPDANDTPTTYYFGVYVMQNEEDYGDGSAVVASDYMFEIDTPVYKVLAAVVP